MKTHRRTLTTLLTSSPLAALLALPACGELTITPNDALEYAEGIDPDILDALEFARGITTVAESEAGLALDMSSSNSFTTRRRPAHWLMAASLGPGALSSGECVSKSLDIQLGGFNPNDGVVGSYLTIVDDPLTDDTLVLELIFNSNETGAVDMGAPENQDFLTCDQCVRLWVLEGEQKVYRSASGTMQISENFPPASGMVTVNLSGVGLIETESYGDATPKEDGACIIFNGTRLSGFPEEWTCPRRAYDDGETCHCGCGLPDPDCSTDGVRSCDECNARGSCAGRRTDCEDIVAEENWACEWEPPGGGPPDIKPPPLPPLVTWDHVEPIMMAKCLGPACHDGPLPPAIVNYDFLLNTDVLDTDDGPTKYVVPFMLDDSLLWFRLNTGGPKHMAPLAWPQLEPAELTLVENWILQGALED